MCICISVYIYIYIYIYNVCMLCIITYLYVRRPGAPPAGSWRSRAPSNNHDNECNNNNANNNNNIDSAAERLRERR